MSLLQYADAFKHENDLESYHVYFLLQVFHISKLLTFSLNPDVVIYLYIFFDSKCFQYVQGRFNNLFTAESLAVL